MSKSTPLIWEDAMDFNKLGIEVFNNVYPGVIGGSLLWMIAKLRKIIKFKKIEREFRISGEYLTSFSDTIEGEKIIQYAPATIYQKGFDITGVTSLGDREWVLEGRISKNGYIYGIYKSNCIYDDGVGNFFLKICNASDEMNGIWSGYDSQNRVMTTGDYKFMRRVNFHIQKLDAKHYYKGIDLIDSQLGKNYIKLDDLNKMNTEKNYLCFEATKDGEFAGIAIGMILNVQETLALLKLKNIDFPKSAFASERVGIVKTVVVAQEYHAHGIGTALVSKLTEVFELHDIHAIACVAWKHDDTENIGGIMRKLEFRCIKEIPNYWKQESEKDYFVCPVCGEPPCRCQANIYFKSV